MGILLPKDYDEDKANLLFHRGRFSAEYCAEKGWDINNLTMEQVMEIRSQPDWKVMPKAEGAD